MNAMFNIDAGGMPIARELTAMSEPIHAGTAGGNADRRDADARSVAGAGPGERSYRLRWWTLGVLSVSLLIIIVDDTIINVALPTLQRELGATAAGLQWIVNAYILVFGGLLLTMGTLGDRFGRRRLLQLGLLIFGLSSLYGAFADSAAQLIAARTAMGVGGALIMPSTLSIIVDVFPREERVRAIGIWAAMAHLGIPLGPVVGGWLLEHYWWGAALLVNVPIVAVVLVAGWLVIPESRHPSPPRADLPGMVLSTAALAALVYAIVEAPAAGWSSGVLAATALAIVSGTAFIAHERRTPAPMLDLKLFRNPRLRWGTVAITLATFALGGLAFDLTQYLQTVAGYTPLQAGLRIAPLVIGFAVAGHAGLHLVRHIGTTRTVAGGLAVVAAAFVAFAQVEPGSAYWLLGIGLFVAGIAMGAVFIPATDAVMAAVPEVNAGLGSALNDTSRQVGAALGVGVLGSLTNAAYSAGIDGALTGLAPSAAMAARRSVGAALQMADDLGGATGEGLRDAAMFAFTDGFALAMLVAAGLLAAGAVLVWRGLPSSDVPPATAHGTQAGDTADPATAAGTADQITSAPVTSEQVTMPPR
jgi:EmrB/QacA subfamily drug resistance transporter